MKKTRLTLILAIASVLSLAGAEPSKTPAVAAPPDTAAKTDKSLLERAVPEEVSLAIYGVYTVAEPDGFQNVLRRNARHGDFGTGIKLDAFFGEHFGLSLGSTIRKIDDVKGSTIDDSTIGPVLRFPSHLFGLSFTPYGKGLVGFDWEKDKWFMGAGAGVSFAVTRDISFFGEADYEFRSRKNCGADDLTFNSGFSYKF